jgi:hypothetical protein
MNTPISFEIAKLLKEKGFDEPCLNFYTNPRCKMFGIDEHNRYYPIKNKAKKLWTSGNAATLDSKHVYYAPTIAEVVMWLYEKHGIWVEVRKHTRNGLRCFSPYIDNKPVREDVFFNDYDLPTEAYEAAIKYCLENLI